MRKNFGVNRYSYKNFNQIINKKSSFLNNLPNQNTKSLKSLNSKKIDILLDEMTGNNKFKRHYDLLSPQIQSPAINANNNNNSNKNKEEKKNTINNENNIYNRIPLFLPYLKIVMTSPNEREYPEKYKKKDFMIDDFSGIYLKPKPISLHKLKQKKIYKQKLHKSNNDNDDFCLPLIKKSHYLSKEIKNNHAFFSSNNISSF